MFKIRGKFTFYVFLKSECTWEIEKNNFSMFVEYVEALKNKIVAWLGKLKSALKAQVGDCNMWNEEVIRRRNTIEI